MPSHPICLRIVLVGFLFTICAGGAENQIMDQPIADDSGLDDQFGESGERVQHRPLVKVDPALQALMDGAAAGAVGSGSLVTTVATGSGDITMAGSADSGSLTVANVAGSANLSTDGMIPVNIFLTVQGGDAVGREVRAANREKMNRLAGQILKIRRAAFPKDRSLNEAEEELFTRVWHTYTPADETDRLRALKLEMDSESARIDREVSGQLRTKFAPSQQTLAAFIEFLGGEVVSRLSSINIISARVPVASLAALTEHELIASISLDHPLQLSLDNQLESLGADTFHTDSPVIDGDPWDVASVDDGVDETHAALSSHNFIENYATNGYHATGTIGMYASTDATYRGLAYGLDTIFVEDWGGSEMISMMGFDWILQYGTENAEVFNYSVNGASAIDTDYSDFDRFFDGIVSTYDFIVSNSAGNYGWGTTTIGHPAPAYNLLVSADMYDQNTVSRVDDTISSLSGTGPTLDGRRKPDITAPGDNTMCPYLGSGWQNLGGTSSAAPKTGAGALLLQDFGVYDAKAVRAILINTATGWTSNNTETTADDGPVSGDHWDKRFGWGYLDLWEAWFNGGDSRTGSVTPRNTPGEYRLYAGFMYPYEKATLVWDRRVGYNEMFYPTEVYDLTDINIRLYDEVGGASGYEDNDFDVDDNVHQVSAAVSGSKVIKVYSWSTAIDGASDEDFAISLEENFAEVSGPDFSTIVITAPDEANCGDQFSVHVQVNNTGDVYGHNVEVTLAVPPGLNIVDGTNPQVLGSVAPGASAVAAWDVYTLYSPSGLGNITASVSADSYGIAQTELAEHPIQHHEVPTHDTCASPVYIPGDYGTHTYMDDSSHACDLYDVEGACTGYMSAGRDLAYMILIPFEATLCVTMTPDASFDPSLYIVTDCADVAGSCLIGSDNVGFGVAEDLCLETPPDGDFYFIIADGYGTRTGGPFQLEVTLSPSVPTETLQVSIGAVPASGVLPFSSSFSVDLTNLTDQNRRAAARIDVQTGGGSSFGNWKSGWTNLSPNETYASNWTQNFPALGSLLGANVFTLVGEDVTPAPYNQLPYSLSGDTDTDAATVTAIAP